MKYGLIVCWVQLEDDYPSKPTHRPIEEVLEAAISDGLRWKDGIVPLTPASCQIDVSIVEMGHGPTETPADTPGDQLGDGLRDRGLRLFLDDGGRNGGSGD